MKLDDKIDIILNKLNGSEGSDLATDIQTWLGEHSNAVDNQLIVDELSDKELIKPKPGGAKLSVITAKGRRVNDRGGYMKYSRRNSIRKALTKIISYANLSFAAINVAVLLYSSNQNKAMEREVERSTLLLEKQQVLFQRSDFSVDSLRKVLSVQSSQIAGLTSALKKLETKKN